MADPTNKKDGSEKVDGQILKKLVRIFRSNNVVRHHFQSPGGQAPQGIAKAFFRNTYSFQSTQIPGYSAYDRFARYSDYSEMESYPVLGNALNIVADETTQKNENGKIIEIISENQDTQSTLQDLFDNVLHLNGKNIRQIARNLCKYGDQFKLIDVTEENGVVGLISMPANEVEREEGFDKEDPAAVRFRWNTKGNVEIPNAYVAHFKLDGNDLFSPYGMSFLEPSRRPWRQLVLLEDAVMIYRISRAAERRVFFLDIMGIPPEDVEPAVEQFSQKVKKNRVVNPDTGKMDLRFGSALSMDEDYIIPVRGSDSSTRIETLPGGQNIGDIEDIEMIKANLFAALGIPKAFLTFDSDAGSKQVLTQEDIRFARTVSKIQEALISELIKIAIIHLYVKGLRGKDLFNFRITMTNPSTVAELQKNELWRARMELVQAAGEGVFDTSFIYKNFLKLSDETVDQIRKGQIQDKIFQAKLIALESSQGMVNPSDIGGLGGGMGGGMMGGGMGGGMPPMGGGMDLGGGMPQMGGGMGAPLPPGGPATGMPAEALNPVFGKDMSRNSTGDKRTAVDRGVDGIGMSEEDDWVDDDPAGIADIRRTISSSSTTTENKETQIKQLLREYSEFTKTVKPQAVQGFQGTTVKASEVSGISEAYLSQYYTTTVSRNSPIGATKLLKEAYNPIEIEILVEDEWSDKLDEMDAKVNKIITEDDPDNT